MEKIFFRHILRRWLPVLLLVPIATSVTTYWLQKDEPPVFTARARLIVGPGIDSPNPDLSALRTGGQLMQTYAELAGTIPFLQAIVDDLDLDMRPEQLGNLIDIKMSPGTQIMSVWVEHADPSLAVSIANATAGALVAISPSGAGSPDATLKEQMRIQATKVEENIVQIEETIERLDRLFQLTSDRQSQQFISEQLSLERGRLSDAHRTLAQLYESLQSAPTNQVRIIEEAHDSQAKASGLKLSVLIAGLAGFALSFVIVMAYEFFDQTIKSEDELEKLTGLPVLITLPENQTRSGQAKKRLFVESLPDSPVAEAYRILGTKLFSHSRLQIERFSEELPKKTIIGRPISTDGPSSQAILIGGCDVNGKSGEIAGNLALVLSQAGEKVILVDANWHHEHMTVMFGAPNQAGLTSWLDGDLSNVRSTLIELGPRMSILPRGEAPANVFELLVSNRMGELIDDLKSDATLVLVATSMLPSLANSLLLASQMDGVLLVANKGVTQSDTIVDVVESLREHDVHLLGMVLAQYRYHGSVEASGNTSRRGSRTRGQQSQSAISPYLPKSPDTLD